MKRSVWTFVAVACIVAVSTGCGRKGGQLAVPTATEAEAVTTDSEPAHEVLVYMIPDSLRTPEQQQLFDRLRQTMAENLQVEDGQLVFTLSEQEFVARGIPKIYYDKLQHDLADANRWVDSLGVEHLEQLLREAYPLPR